MFGTAVHTCCRFFTMVLEEGSCSQKTGTKVPFTSCNYAYRDQSGRETVTWTRSFSFAKKCRKFDEYIVFSERRRSAVVYAGTHQHLCLDLDFSVGENGSLIIKTGRQRVFAGPFSLTFPRLFSGDAIVTEAYNDASHKFEVEVSIREQYLGQNSGLPRYV